MKMIDYLVDELVSGIDWFIWVLMWVREELRPTAKVKVHTGGMAIVADQDVLKVQPGLIKLFKKSEKKALIVQKMHEWVQVNVKKGSHEWDGETWTYGSYGDWLGRHFDWFSEDWLGKLIKELVTDGYLIATNKAPFCFKGQFAYRVNYDRINSEMGCDKVIEGVEESHTPCMTNSEEGSDKVIHNNRVKQGVQSNSSKQGKASTTAAARVSPLGPPDSQGEVTDVGVAVGENQDSDSGVFAGMGEMVSGTEDRDIPPQSPHFVGGSQAESKALPPPDSARPPSPFIQRLMDSVTGLTQKVAESLLTQAKGDERWLMDVVNHALKDKKIHTPIGWIIDEIKMNRQGYKEKTSQPKNRPEGHEHLDWSVEQWQEYRRKQRENEQKSQRETWLKKYPNWDNDENWDKAVEIIRQKWDESSFKTWLEPCTFAKVEQGIGTYIIATPNSYVCDMMQYRLYDDVAQALSEVVGKEVKIEYRVMRGIKNLSMVGR